MSIDLEKKGIRERQRRKEDRPSAIGASLGRRSGSFVVTEETQEANWSQDGTDLRDSVIGVASTTSVPASSSRTVVAPGAYPNLDAPRTATLSHPDRPVSITGASDVGRLMLSELDDAPAPRQKVSDI